MPVETTLSEFLDHYYTISSADRPTSLAAEPAILGRPRIDALVAALAEHLAKSYSTEPPPTWIEEPSRFLPIPWFTVREADPGLREYLTFQSPAAFKRRNIMTDGSPLRRASTPLGTEPPR